MLVSAIAAVLVTILCIESLVSLQGRVNKNLVKLKFEKLYSYFHKYQTGHLLILSCEIDQHNLNLILNF